MVSLYAVDASGSLFLLARDLSGAEAVALAGDYYRKTGRTAIQVLSGPGGGAADV